MTTLRGKWARAASIAFATVASVTSTVAFASVPPDVEPKYAAAVLAFQAGQFASASQILDQILVRLPKQVEATELKALTLKAMGKNAEAISLFKILLAEKVDQDKPDTPYLFELGTLYYRQKSFEEARSFLNQSLQKKFNSAAAHYLMGTLEFSAQKYSASESHFISALETGELGLQGPAHLYLAELSNIANDRADTVFHYYRAKETALLNLKDTRSNPEESALAKQVIASVDKMVGSLDRNLWFGSAGLFSGYDSNVLFTPASVSSPAEGPSGRGSLRQLLVGEMGYATSPMRDFQVVPLFRSSWNYNFNSALKNGSFLTGEFSLTLVRKPLAKVSYGLRVGALGAFRYTLDPSTGSQRYRTYSTVGILAPFAKFGLANRWSLTGSFVLSPQRFFQDSETDLVFRKSGAEYTAEVLLRKDRGHAYWNPMAALRGSLRYSRGIEFRNRGLELEIGNLFYFNQNASLSAFASLNSFSFKAREDGARFDVGFSTGATFDYRISQPITLTANLEYAKNNSNISLPYGFKRFLLNVGATYRF